MSTLAGPVALVGSGEYLPSMAGIEGALLAGRPPVYVQLATAAVPDGPAVLARWHELGRAQAERLGARQVIVDVRDRAGADRAANADLIAGAGLVYLSGGKPDFLATTLRDTAVWHAMVAAWQGGAALAGCSAGAMALTAWIPSLRHPRRGGTPGLGLLPGLRVIPHFDAFTARMPDLVTRMLAPRPDDPGQPVTLLGIDEQTALVGGPDTWTVAGLGSVWRLTPDGRERFPSGTNVELAAV